MYLVFFVLLSLTCQKKDVWTAVDQGLYFGDFDVSSPIPFNEAIITIFKVDPHLYQFHLLTISEQGHQALTLPEWCEKYDLIGGINAGMYQEDMKSNVGYLKNYQHTNNGHINSSHHSMAAFNPLDSMRAPFYLYDIDDYPADSVIANYHSVVQNLRLIKRPGENRWIETNKRWCEAAVGQDQEGNALLIYCRAPLTMSEFNDALLSLPIDLTCAMHVEGGQPASLFFSHRGLRKSFSGTNETKYDADGTALNAARIPNIIGFTHKTLNK